MVVAVLAAAARTHDRGWWWLLPCCRCPCHAAAHAASHATTHAASHATTPCCCVSAELRGGHGWCACVVRGRPTKCRQPLTMTCTRSPAHRKSWKGSPIFGSRSAGWRKWWWGPEFHLELNFIERYWGRTKTWLRWRCDDSWHSLVRNVDKVLNRYMACELLLRWWCSHEYDRGMLPPCCYSCRFLYS